MTVSIFASGLLLGLSIAAPVGPMGLLCINRTLQRGLVAGLCVGFGIATGDAAYGAVAALGLATVTDALIAYALPLRLIGGGFLIWMGIKAWRMAHTPRPPRDRIAGNGGLTGDYAIAVGLTLTNPATILSFIATFGALGLATREGGAGLLVAGVFLGSALWWLGLCTAIALARKALTTGAMVWIDRLSALVLIAFGMAAAAGWLAS